MNMAHSIAVASVAVCAVLLALLFRVPAEAQRTGPFELVFQGGSGVVWRINSATGAVSYCFTGQMPEAPSCSGWRN
jgi:hypothetical protein